MLKAERIDTDMQQEFAQEVYIMRFVINSHEEGIYVNFTNKRLKTSPYPTFLGQTKSCSFCLIDIRGKLSTTCYVMS